MGATVPLPLLLLFLVGDIQQPVAVSASILHPGEIPIKLCLMPIEIQETHSSVYVLILHPREVPALWSQTAIRYRGDISKIQE